MKPGWFGPGDMAWLEAESDEEREFLKSCPDKWTAERCFEVWKSGVRWRGGEIKYLL